jgi:hypothetical protein
MTEQQLVLASQQEEGPQKYMHPVNIMQLRERGWYKPDHPHLQIGPHLGPTNDPIGYAEWKASGIQALRFRAIQNANRAAGVQDVSLTGGHATEPGAHRPGTMQPVTPPKSQAIDPWSNTGTPMPIVSTGAAPATPPAQQALPAASAKAWGTGPYPSPQSPGGKSGKGGKGGKGYDGGKGGKWQPQTHGYSAS